MGDIRRMCIACRHYTCADMTAATSIRYQLVTVNKNWTEAHLSCANQRMNLVVILDDDEHLALQAYIEAAIGRRRFRSA